MTRIYLNAGNALESYTTITEKSCYEGFDNVRIGGSCSEVP